MAGDGPISLLPPSPLDEDVFPLRRDHMYLIQKYVKTGTILPITVPDYKACLKLDAKTVEKFLENVTAIVAVYAEIREHTIHYQGTVHPDTVNLSLSITHYAAVVDVVYGNIFDAIMALDAANKLPDSPEKELLVQRNIAIVKLSIDTQVSYMSTLAAHAAIIVDQLRIFEADTQDDHTKLVREHKALTDKLGNNDEIEKLQTEIKRLRGLIAEEQKEYEDLMEKIDDIPKWAWINLIALATGAALKSKWTKEANAIAERLETNKEDMEETEAELESLQAMLAQASLMDSDLSELIKMIEPAITTVQLMQGSFGAISDDLTSVKDKVDNGVREANAIIVDVQIDVVKEAWRRLGEKANVYLGIAYIQVYDYANPSKTF